MTFKIRELPYPDEISPNGHTAFNAIMPPDLTKESAIVAAKQFRKDLDDLLQQMKAHRATMLRSVEVSYAEDQGEAIAQHTLSIRDLESAIMRQGMALKYIGNPDPYPNSKDTSNTVVDPTADGLKL
jgi:hypothetical protein